MHLGTVPVVNTRHLPQFRPQNIPHRWQRVPSVQRINRSPSRPFGRVRGTPDPTPQAICIGEALFDMLANDYDVPRDRVRSWTPKAGGAVCNVAAGLAKFGVRVSFITAVGSDALGDQLIDTLTRAGVPAADIQRRPEPTRDVYVTRKTGGEREFVGFSAEADQYADCHIDIASLPVEKIKAASVVVSGTLGLAFDGTGSAIRKAVSIARSAGICVFIDVNWRPVFFKDPTVVKDDITAFVRQADIVKLTDDEAQWMFDIPADVARQAPNEVLAQLPTARGVLVTAGEKGATYCFRTQYGLHSGFFPAFAVDVVDTTGAGDAFTSGFLYQMLKYGGIDGFLASPDAVDDAVEFASASGGVTASGAGAMEAQPKSPSEVMQLIEVYKCP